MTVSVIDKVQNAIDYVEGNLTEILEVETVAQHVDFSMWHFQRVFAAIVGETFKSYVRKRRLSAALREIVETDTRILDIAVSYGFESQESFSRAFKTMFGENPGMIRKIGRITSGAGEKPRITVEYVDQMYGGMSVKPTIVDFESKTFVGMGTRFISILSKDKNNHEVIPQLWGKYIEVREKIKNTKGLVDYGLCAPLSNDMVRNHPDEFYYMACAEVDGVEDVPAGMESKTIEAGRYAKFTHVGSLANLEKTMSYIFGSWLAKSEFELREAPDLEIYDKRFNPTSAGSEMDILIPIQ